MEPWLEMPLLQREKLLHARVVLYLRAHGFDTESAEARIQGICARQKLQPDQSEADALREAMNDTMENVQVLIEELLGAVWEAKGANAGLVHWRLRRALSVCSQAEFHTTEPPAELRQALRKARMVVLPAETQMEMPIQELGRAPTLLRAAYWRKLARQYIGAFSRRKS